MRSDMAEVEPFLGSVGIGDERRFRLTTPISAEEHKAIDRGLGALARLGTPFTYKLVERNFLVLEDSFCLVVMRLTADAGLQPDRRALGESLMTAIVNWLTSVRLFLDHELTALSRRHGPESSQLERFEASTRASYDGHPGYRFVYRFRNYVQHCGLPLSSMTMELVNPGSANEGRRALLRLRRDDLLTAFDGWGPHVTADLEAMEPDFEILPLLDDAMEGLRAVYRELLGVHLDDALSEVAGIARALDRLADLEDDEAPALFLAEFDGLELRHLQPRLIDRPAVETLMGVNAGRIDRASLFAAADRELLEARPLAPSEVARSLRPGSKGLEVLALFFSEHGASPIFLDRVNSYLGDEEALSSFVGGLIDAGLVLAAMTASLLGAEPGGMIAGLQSMYLTEEPGPA